MEAVAHGELWRTLLTWVPAPSEVEEYIRAACEMQQTGTALPFAIVDRRSNRAVGSTRFFNHRAEHRSTEIGSTWLGEPWQRTAINTEAKYYLLNYAFESLECIRVELKTDVLNDRSRRAIERIGGIQEGIFRRHMIMPNGRIRDTVYYSIVDTDWPTVRAGLLLKLNQPKSEV